jgi:hypothetical protein
MDVFLYGRSLALSFSEGMLRVTRRNAGMPKVKIKFLNKPT